MLIILMSGLTEGVDTIRKKENVILALIAILAFGHVFFVDMVPAVFVLGIPLWALAVLVLYAILIVMLYVYVAVRGGE